MLLRIIRGKLKPGTWDAFEKAYRATIASTAPVEGLRGRWLVQDLDDPDSGSSISLWATEEALHAYESSEVLKNTIIAKLSPFFSGQYETRRSRVRFSEGSPRCDNRRRRSVQKTDTSGKAYVEEEGERDAACRSCSR